ncbi:MAG: hypothetical protein ACI35J_11995, partial [Peribacillus sp.]
MPNSRHCSVRVKNSCVDLFQSAALQCPWTILEKDKPSCSVTRSITDTSSYLLAFHRSGRHAGDEVLLQK